MEKHLGFRLFLVIIFVFIGAVIFLSEPFINKNKTPIYNAVGNTVSASVDGVVKIKEEAVATTIPSASGENNRWILLAIAVTVINLGGSIAIVFITSKDTSQV